MKQSHLQWAVESITTAQRFLEIVKAEDIKHRKDSKASRKKKWTRSIKDVNNVLILLRSAKRVVRSIPKRV